MQERRIVIIGTGFAGLALANDLKEAGFSIILIDKSNHHLFQPLLYQVATAALSPAKITYPIRELFRKRNDVKVIMGEAIHVDKEKKTVVLSGGEEIGYDLLVIATGVSHSYFGREDWEPFAPGLKTVRDAIAIREQILSSFEIAERLGNDEKADPYLRFVIIGGGPTGAEMAGSIADIAKTSLRENFHNIQPERAKIVLIEALPEILPSYPPRLAARARKNLQELGVEVVTGKKVSSISEEGVLAEDLFFPTVNIIWAAGTKAGPLIARLDSPLDKQGRALIETDLSLPGYPDVFVIGDAGCIRDNPLPATASVAVQQGKYLAKILKTSSGLNPRPPFVYKDKGSLATIGKGKAIAKIGKLQFWGPIAWLFWGVIHIVYLVGFRNRLRVLFEWFTLFFTGRRAVRLILGTIDKKMPKQS